MKTKTLWLNNRSKSTRLSGNRLMPSAKQIMSMNVVGNIINSYKGSKKTKENNNGKSTTSLAKS